MVSTRTDQSATHAVGLATITVDLPTLLVVLIGIKPWVVAVLVEAPSRVRTPVEPAHLGVHCMRPQRNLTSLTVGLGDNVCKAMQSARA